jgi:hypothetical protein
MWWGETIETGFLEQQPINHRIYNMILVVLVLVSLPVGIQRGSHNTIPAAANPVRIALQLPP